MHNWVDRSGFMIKVTFELVNKCVTVNRREEVSISMLIAKHRELSREVPETKSTWSMVEDLV